MTKEIQLTKGQVALVDDGDYDFLMQWKWFALRTSRRGGYYAVKNSNNGEKTKMTYMHRLILMVFDKKEIVDHINHNTLDNRRENLRVLSQRQNLQNLKRKTSSKYPGVSWVKASQKWKAAFQYKGKIRYLGLYYSEEEAYQAYKLACKKFCHEPTITKHGEGGMV